MSRRAPLSDELRADLIETLWAYIEGTNNGVLEWPPQVGESQPTPISARAEKAFLFEIAARVAVLRDSLGDNGGRST